MAIVNPQTHTITKKKQTRTRDPVLDQIEQELSLVRSIRYGDMFDFVGQLELGVQPVGR